MANKDRLFWFGKYKGYTIKSVIRCNPNYVTWLQRNINFKITDDEKEYWQHCVRENSNIRDTDNWECSNPWEAMAYEGVISPYGGDFM